MCFGFNGLTGAMLLTDFARQMQANAIKCKQMHGEMRCLLLTKG